MQELLKTVRFYEYRKISLPVNQYLHDQKLKKARIRKQNSKKKKNVLHSRHNS